LNPSQQKKAIERMTEQAYKMLRSNDAEYARALLKKYARLSQRIEADIMQITEDASVDGDPSYSEFLKIGGRQKTLTVIKREIQAINQDIIPSLEQHLVQQYKEAYTSSAWTLDQSTPESVDVNYSMPSDSIIKQFVSSEWNSAMFSQRIGVINDMMASEIQSAVNNAMLTGQSNQNLAKIISDIIGSDGNGGTSYRARTIAISETARSANLARNKFFDDNDKYISDWYWLSRSIMSPRICDDCAERSGKFYDEVVEIAEEQEKPVDAPIHPRCACSWMAKPKTFSELLGPEFSKMDEPVEMSYEKWKQQFHV
jgi:hypothetical protein